MASRTRLIDAHFHVWDLSRQRLPWLDGVDPSLSRTFGPDEYLALYDRREDVELLGGVYVEVDADDCELEDRIVAGLGQRRLLARAMRAHLGPAMRVPLMASAVREPLHTPEAAPGRCLEPEFLAGLRLLAAAGLPFEACVRTPELADLYEACAQVPEATVVIDHMGNVESLDAAFVGNMERLASLPNVVVKMSGYATSSREFVHELSCFARQTFGSDRLMYASNWPVVGLYSSFDEHLSLVLEEFAGDEDFFVRTAERIYGIDL